MDNDTTWTLIHGERRAAVATLKTLTPEQWDTPSLCEGWTVKLAAAHMLKAAEQTPGMFMKGMFVNGFRFNVMTDRDARELGELPPAELIARLEARNSTTNHPPAPVVAMLGEVMVHSEDIRRPLGLTHEPDPAAVVALLEAYKTTNFPVGAKKRITGLRLVATDLDWSHGEGPEVTGPGMDLAMAMVGRYQALDALAGPGLPTFVTRVA